MKTFNNICAVLVLVFCVQSSVVLAQQDKKTPDKERPPRVKVGEKDEGRQPDKSRDNDNQNRENNNRKRPN